MTLATEKEVLGKYNFVYENIFDMVVKLGPRFRKAL